MRHLLGAALALLAASPLCAQATISPLPTPPSRNDPNNFSARADAFLAALPGMASQMNTVAAQTAAAANSAINAPGTSGQSGTSLPIGIGGKALVIQAGKAFVVGQFVQIASVTSPTNYMNGQITGYDASSGTLTVNVSYAAGSGSFASWNVALSTPVDPSRFAQVAGGTFTGAISAPGMTSTGGFGVNGNSTFNGEVSFRSAAAVAGGFQVNGTSSFNGRAGFTGGLDAAGPISREVNNFIDQDGSGMPIWVVKNGSFMRYDRINDKFVWVINNVVVMSVDGGGNLALRGGVYPNGNP
jgi:hypothetical protein